jgi:RHS repeat-associated protein
MAGRADAPWHPGTPAHGRSTTMRRYLLSLIAVGLWPTLTFAQTSAQVVEYYHTDALGSVRAVTKVVNGQVQVVSRHDFKPFGEEVAPQNPPVDKRLFTGKERDAETGQDYFGARYYRADLGRFTTTDPVQTWDENLADPQRWNRYGYVRNNPLKYVDPDGSTMDFANQRSERLFNDYEKALGADPEGHATLLATIQLLKNSRINYRIDASGTEGTGEGFLSADNRGNVLVSVRNIGGPSGETMDMNGRFAHEIEHARQFNQGELGLMKRGDKWGAFPPSYDLLDEANAFSAQLVASRRVIDSPFLRSLRGLSADEMLARVAGAYPDVSRRGPSPFAIIGAAPGIYRTPNVYGVVR